MSSVPLKEGCCETRRIPGCARVGALEDIRCVGALTSHRVHRTAQPQRHHAESPLYRSGEHPGLSAMASAPNFSGYLDLYNGRAAPSGGGITTGAWVPGGKDEAIVGVTGVNASKQQTATLNLCNGRPPSTSASGPTAHLHRHGWSIPRTAPPERTSALWRRSPRPGEGDPRPTAPGSVREARHAARTPGPSTVGLKSISCTSSRPSAAVAPSGSRRHQLPTTMPTNLCPSSRNARPPSVPRSVTRPRHRRAQRRGPVGQILIGRHRRLSRTDGANKQHNTTARVGRPLGPLGTRT
jgi:hypothetical protein